MSDNRFQMIVQAVVTIGMLGFAFVMEPKAPGVASVVVGGVMAHWFKEAGHFGRQAKADNVQVQGDDVTVTEKAGRAQEDQ